MKLNPDVRPCDEVKKSVSENYCTNMCSMSVTLIGVVDVKLAQEI